MGERYAKNEKQSIGGKCVYFFYQSLIIFKSKMYISCQSKTAYFYHRCTDSKGLKEMLLSIKINQSVIRTSKNLKDFVSRTLVYSILYPYFTTIPPFFSFLLRNS